MSDLPNPSAGGSYLRNDATGELILVSGPTDDLTPAMPPVVPEEAPAELPPDVPPVTPPEEE